MSEDEALNELRKRILQSRQMQIGSKIWVPHGDTRWSAIEVTQLKRVWGRGRRVKPATQKQGSIGKFKVDRVLKRDPSKEGRDKPHVTPLICFAHFKEEPEQEPEQEPEEEEKIPLSSAVEPVEPLAPVIPRTPEEELAHRKHIADLVGLLEDKSTVDDW